MKLLWCAYQKESGKPAKHCLYLDIGRDDNKQYAVIADSLDNDDISIIRQQATNLDMISTKDRIEWLKSNCPKAMNNFRSLMLSKLKVLKEYDIKTI